MSSLAVGTAVGVALTGVFSLLVRHVRPFTRLETALHDMLGSLSEREITVVSLFSALGEEFFFRLAMQDAIGLYWSAAIFGLLHFGPKGTMLWTVMAFVLGLGFGWMVELGCGLLSVTVAHALVNLYFDRPIPGAPGEHPPRRRSGGRPPEPPGPPARLPASRR